MQITAFAHTDRGLQREENEDCYGLDEELKLYIIADGMGGHAAGAVASRTAVDVLKTDIQEAKSILTDYQENEELRDQVKQMLEDGVRRAGVAIFQMAQADGALRGMGTTLSVLLITPTRGFIAHVGDSRIYLIRQDEVIQLTEDHSLLNEMLKQGRILPSQAKNTRYSNAVTRAVGVYADVQVDTLDFELAAGDTFLLCTDGLSQYFKTSREIADTIQTHGLSQSAKILIDLANGRGGSDNSTAIVVRVTARRDELQAPDPKDVARRLKTLRKMPLFQHLSYVELVEVLNVSEVKSYKKGDYIFQDGEVGDEMYVVLEGKVSIHKNDVRLAKLGAGGHFGEMAILDECARSADVRADRETRVVAIHRRPLFALMRRDKEIAVKLLWCFLQVLNRRLRTTNLDLMKASANQAQVNEIPGWEDFSSLE